MTDAHFHRRTYETFLGEEGREMRFLGVHPWQAEDVDAQSLVETVELSLAEDPSTGVGEIGLDRLRTKAMGLGILDGSR